MSDVKRYVDWNEVARLQQSAADRKRDIERERSKELAERAAVSRMYAKQG